MASTPPKARPLERGAGHDWGRVFALMLSIVFAVIGAIPLALGFLVRTAPVRAWAARATSALLADELELNAHYRVSVQAWPMLIALDDLVVEASDGGTPFLQVERAAVRPRPFSLLAGKLDVGDVEIVGPRIRAVVEDGKLVNLHYKLPKSAPAAGPARPPLASIAITDARLDATIEGFHVDTREVDLDLSVEEGNALELAFRAGETELTRTHPVPGREAREDAVDEDVICRLDARVRVEGRSVVVRRMLLQGSVDFDPDPGTRPSCELEEHDWRAVELRLGAVHVELPEGGPVQARGRIHAAVPAALVHRFVDVPRATGSVTLDVEADYDGVSKLPILTGHVAGDQPGIDGKLFAKHFDLDLTTTENGTVLVSKLVALWADGKVTIPEVKIEPFVKGVPLTTGPVAIEGIEFHALLRDLGVHPRAHVAWTLDKGRFEHFKGTLSPVLLEGPLTVSTHGFEIYDRPVVDPLRGHRMGVKEATIRGNFVVNGQERSPLYKFPGVILSNFTIDTPRSHVHTTVSLGFLSVLDIEVHEGTKIDLADISPIIDIALSGQATVKANGRGPFEHPKFEGEIGIKDFTFAGFPIGELEPSKVAFEPLVLDLLDAHLRHGPSRIRTPLTRIAFDKGPNVLIDSDLDTREAPHVRIKDLFEIFHIDKDPRFSDIEANASGKAHAHYELGGKGDRCGGGALDVRAELDLSAVSLLGEKWDEGTASFDFLWDDQLAGSEGMRVDLRSATLRKGPGTVLATATVRHGGLVEGMVIGNGVPIGKLDLFGAWGKLFDGSVSLVANLGGTLADFTMMADVDASRIRIGPASLPSSRLRVSMEPAGTPRKVAARTICGNPRSAAFDAGELEKDPSSGFFKVSGSLFEGQVTLDGVKITRQKRKILDGRVHLDDLNLGTLANLVPGVAFTVAPPKGKLTASLDIKSLPLGALERSEMTLSLQKLELEQDGASVRLAAPSGPIALSRDELDVPDLRITARARQGVGATFVAGGKVHRATTAPDLDLAARIDPAIDLSTIGAGIAGVDRAVGTVDASLTIRGRSSAPTFGGAAHLRRGELALRGLPASLQDIDVDIDIRGGDAVIKRAKAHLGGGTLDVSGRVSLRGPDAGAATATLVARGVKVPVADGVIFTADADLEAGYRPASSTTSAARTLPDVKGTVSLTSFSYTRPIALNVNLAQLGRSPRTNVDAYDPANDVVHFDIKVVSPRPLRFRNNLVDMELAVTDPGLALSGTNQRYGARGLLRILPDSKLQLRASEFLVREGTVRFDDPLKIAPQVDVRAQSDYRRYASAAAEQSVASTGGGGISTSGTQGGSGVWRITLNAHGDAENLKVTLGSDPPLSQEDIVLLLTIGMTRAEIDRGAAASSLGETFGLEALSALTGADKAVKTIVPLIDEFRFGSGYSSKTGRTEPTVTLGKRITDSVRATVTTGITENREVRSNVEWRLNRRMSIQGSYDNVNDVSSSALGNVGVDLRWRLEFE